MIKEGQSFKQLRTTLSEYTPTTELKNKALQEFQDFQEQVTNALAGELTKGSIDHRLGSSWQDRLATVAFESSYAEAFGEPQRDSFTGPKADEKYAKALKTYQFSHAFVQRIENLNSTLKSKAVESEIIRGIVEASTHISIGLVDPNTLKVSHENFKQRVSEATKGKKGKEADIGKTIDNVVFPKRDKDGKIPVYQDITPLSFRKKFDAACQCIPITEENAQIVAEIQHAVFSEPGGKQKIKKPDMKALAVRRQAFIAEPVISSLTVDMYREKIMYSVIQSGILGSIPEDVREIMSKHINKFAQGYNTSAVIGSVNMLKEMCDFLSKTQQKEHKVGRAVFDAMVHLFDQHEFKELQKRNVPYTYESVQKQFLSKIVLGVTTSQSNAIGRGEILKGYEKRVATNKTAISVFDDLRAEKVMVPAGTLLQVDSKSMKQNRQLAVVRIDGVSYYVAKDSLSNDTNKAKKAETSIQEKKLKNSTTKKTSKK